MHSAKFWNRLIILILVLPEEGNQIGAAIERNALVKALKVSRIVFWS